MITKERIIEDVITFITQKQQNKKWVAGKDFVNYAGPHFNQDEFAAAVSTLLDGWLVMGDKCLEFERRFPKEFGKHHGVLT